MENEHLSTLLQVNMLHNLLDNLKQTMQWAHMLLDINFKLRFYEISNDFNFHFQVEYVSVL